MLVQRRGDFDLYFRQSDHARLAAELARHLRVDISLALGQAIETHDDGWDRLDIHPAITPAGKCCDVFDCPWRDSLAAWRGSIDAAREPAVQLLVSIHFLHLAAAAMPGRAAEGHAAGFEFNRFVQEQIELQDSLRSELGYAPNLPRHLGIAARPPGPQEERLRDDVLILTAMDDLSLSLLRDELAAETLALPGGVTCSLRLEAAGRVVMSDLTDASSKSFHVPVRVLEHRRWTTASNLSEALGDAEPRSITVDLSILKSPA